MYQHPTLRFFSTRSLDSRNLFNILKIYVRHFRSKVFLLHALNLICNTGIPTKFLLMIGQKKETCLQLHVLITQRKQTFVSEIFWGHSWLAEGCQRLKKIEHFIFKKKFQILFKFVFHGQFRVLLLVSI